MSRTAAEALAIVLHLLLGWVGLVQPDSNFREKRKQSQLLFAWTQVKYHRMPGGKIFWDDFFKMADSDLRNFMFGDGTNLAFRTQVAQSTGYATSGSVGYQQVLG